MTERIASGRFRRDMLWGLAAQGLSVAAGLILLPAALRYLPNEQLGLWFVFITLSSLVQLLELGFQPTISRNVAYVYAGAQQLVASGHAANTSPGQLNPALLQQLFFAARKVYRNIAALAALAFLLPGTFYLLSLRPDNLPSSTLLWAWVTFALGYVFNFYYGYFNGFLQGRGQVTAANQVQVANRASMLILGSLLLMLDWGLPGLGIASLFSCLISRVLARHFFWQAPETQPLRQANTPDHNPLLAVLWHNASKLGWVSLGAFLINRANMLLASSLLGLGVAASYGLTLQVLMTATAFANVALGLKLPQISASHIHGQAHHARHHFAVALIAGWLIYGGSALLLLWLGNDLLHLLGSKTHLLAPLELALLAAILLLELNHSLFATYLTTLNQVPFVKAALLSGMAIVSGGLLSIQWLGWGLLGMISAQGLVQLAYNNWQWPRLALRQMQCSLGQLLSQGLHPLR